MSEAPVCRVCYEDENNVDLISPCNCIGSMKFICKDCLNQWLKCNKSDKRYFECNECKKKYNRLEPSGKDSRVDFEMATYTTVLTIASAVLLVSMIFLCGISPLMCSVILVLLYIVTVSLTIISQNNLCAWFFIVLFFCTLYVGKKIKNFIVDLWLILGYGSLAYIYISDLWNSTKMCITSNYLEKCKPMMYDYHRMKYIEGVL